MVSSSLAVSTMAVFCSISHGRRFCSSKQQQRRHVLARVGVDMSFCCSHRRWPRLPGWVLGTFLEKLSPGRRQVGALFCFALLRPPFVFFRSPKHLLPRKRKMRHLIGALAQHSRSSAPVRGRQYERAALSSFGSVMPGKPRLELGTRGRGLMVGLRLGERRHQLTETWLMRV